LSSLPPLSVFKRCTNRVYIIVDDETLVEVEVHYLASNRIIGVVEPLIIGFRSLARIQEISKTLFGYAGRYARRSVLLENS
jgi:hypothetical protein